MREMKNSGIEWVGTIPSNWMVMPNKRIMHKQKVLCDKYNGEDILSLTMNGVIVRNLNAGGKVPTTFDGYQIVNSNNLLMCLFDYDVTPRCIGLIKNNGLTSPAYSQFIIDNGNIPSYYYYYYLMVDNTKELLHLAKNLRHSFTEEQLGEIYAPVPPIKEQEKIARFLDEKVQEIDNAIIKTKETIEDYKKMKSNIITKTILFGVNNNDKKNETNCIYAKHIAKTATIAKLKQLVNKPITDGTHSTPDYSDEINGSPFLSSKDISGGYINWDNIKYITKELHEELYKNTQPHKGDILLAKNGTTGIAALIDEEKIFDIYVTLALISPNTQIVIPKYLLYAINSDISKKQFNEHLIGVGVPNLHLNVINDTKIVIHDKNTQKQIVEYLDERCNEIDKLIENKEKIIVDLENYKKSVIYEYVTGKKEVK